MATITRARRRATGATGMLLTVIVPLGIVTQPGAAGADPQGTPYSFHLIGVDAIATDDVWAVGESFDGNRFGTYIQHYDGHTWQPVDCPDPKKHSNTLLDVSGAATDDVWAVGNAYNNKALVLHWDGTSWSRVPLQMHTQFSQTLGVDLATTTDGWLVGAFGDLPHVGALAAHFNGHAWRQVDTPDPGGDLVSSVLTNVSIIAPADVWAVGYAEDANRHQYPLTEHWDGKAWTIVDANFSHRATLSSVSGTSADDVWAVGTQQVAGRVKAAPLTEHWDGHTWTVVADPTIPGRKAYVHGVAAVAPDDVWAVGLRRTSDAPQGKGPNIVPITMHWDGVAWTLVEGAFPGKTPALRDVSALASNDIWAAGDTYNGSGYQPMTAHWDGTAWRS